MFVPAHPTMCLSLTPLLRRPFIQVCNSRRRFAHNPNVPISSIVSVLVIKGALGQNESIDEGCCENTKDEPFKLDCFCWLVEEGFPALCYQIWDLRYVLFNLLPRHSSHCLSLFLLLTKSRKFLLVFGRRWPARGVDILAHVRRVERRCVSYSSATMCDTVRSA